MSSFVKLGVALALTLLPLGAFSQNASDAKATPAAKDSGDKKKDKGKKNKGDNGAPKPMEIPVPQGHDAKGLKIPYFDGEGKLQMIFTIGVASRIDETHVRMTDLDVETFDDEGQHEMNIDLPTSVLDTETNVLSTKQHVTIKRADFELTGETMEFNTKTKQGGLGGNVRMLIYNLEAETSADIAPAAKPAETGTSETNSK